MKISKTIDNFRFSGLEKTITVIQPHGIHMAPSSIISSIVSLSPKKDIFISSDKIKPTKLYPSFMQIFTFELHRGDTIKLYADDNYSKTLFNAIVDCFAAKDIKELYAIKKNILNMPKTSLK